MQSPPCQKKAKEVRALRGHKPLETLSCAHHGLVLTCRGTWFLEAPGEAGGLHGETDSEEPGCSQGLHLCSSINLGWNRSGHHPGTASAEGSLLDRILFRLQAGLMPGSGVRRSAWQTSAWIFTRGGVEADEQQGPIGTQRGSLS